MFEASDSACAAHSQSVDSLFVTARYLLHIASAQLYVDPSMQTCRAPRDGPVDDPRPVYFEPVAGASLLDRRWDGILARYTFEERRLGRLWERQPD